MNGSPIGLLLALTLTSSVVYTPVGIILNGDSPNTTVSGYSNTETITAPSNSSSLGADKSTVSLQGDALGQALGAGANTVSLAGSNPVQGLRIGSNRKTVNLSTNGLVIEADNANSNLGADANNVIIKNEVT